MWLINVDTRKLEPFEGKIPPYAILSHRWDDHELSFRDFEDDWSIIKTKPGAEKIEYTCKLAKADGLQYAWIDTCSIDKSSSAELSEAINSMFRWYKRSQVCYAYLSDVEADTFDKNFRNSKWFTRGWTLQELIAPQNLNFYSKDWKLVGSKQDLIPMITSITGIDEASLLGSDLKDVSIAKRMSWAAKRETTRVEDKAYCLLGIFDVNMPMLYGEGDKAFLRLQREILQISNDQSLFAWGMPPVLQAMDPTHIIPEPGSSRAGELTLRENWYLDLEDESLTNDLRGVNLSPRLGMFAQSPADFEHCGSIIEAKHWLGQRLASPATFANTMRLNLPTIEGEVGTRHHGVAILGCYDSTTLLVVGILFKWQRSDVAGRIVKPIGIPVRETILQDYWVLLSLFRSIYFIGENVLVQVGNRILVDDSSAISAGYTLTKFFCIDGPQKCNCNPKQMEYVARTKGRRAVFLYESPHSSPIWVMIGKFKDYQPAIPIHPTVPIYPVSRNFVRAGFFHSKGDTEFKALELLRQPKKIVDWKKSTSESMDDELDADYIAKRTDNGKETKELYGWSRAVEALDTGTQPGVQLSIFLRRSLFPEHNDCEVEERLTIRVHPGVHPGVESDNKASKTW